MDGFFSSVVEEVSKKVIQTGEDVSKQVIEEVVEVSKKVIETGEDVSKQVIEEVVEVSKKVIETGEDVSKKVIDEVVEVSKKVIETGEDVSKKVIETVEDQFNHLYELHLKDNEIEELKKSGGSKFPGSDYSPPDRANWMFNLNPDKTRVNQIVWPGTHDSATDKIGDLFTHPFAVCQNLSIYDQLKLGARVFDIRVRKDLLVCHGDIPGYHVDVVINDVKKFLEETLCEIIILEIRTEYKHDDPPEFDRFLKDRLGKFLIHQNDNVFNKTISELLPGRVICVWKPTNTRQPNAGDSLWSSGYLRDDWIDTDILSKKFKSNMDHLMMQEQVVMERKYFYRVENTLTTQAGHPVSWVTPLSNMIKPYARTFIAQCFIKEIGDKLQIFSTDFIEEDFVDACVGLTYARVEGKDLVN